MDGILSQAVRAAEERKGAVIGSSSGELELGFHRTDPTGTRALFSGFDLEHDELAGISHRAGRLFAQMAAAGQPLPDAFLTCWCDALLVGLFAAQIAARELSDPVTDGPPDAG